MNIRQQPWTRVGVVAGLSVIALVVASIAIWQGPALAGSISANPAEGAAAVNPEAARTNLRHVDCPENVSAHSNVCVSWTGQGGAWPKTQIKVYRYGILVADRLPGNPLTDFGHWYPKRVTSAYKLHNGPSGNAVKITNLEPDQLYLVTVQGHNNGTTDTGGAVAVVRTAPVPVVSNLRLSPDCDFTGGQMCLDWDMDQRDANARVELIFYASADESALADTGPAINGKSVFRSRALGGHARMYKVTGYEPMWYRVKLEATIAGEKQSIWTPESYLMTPPWLSAEQPKPRCVSQFETAAPWMGLDDVSDGTLGLLTTCRPQHVNAPPLWGFVFNGIHLTVDSLDAQESYSSEIAHNDGNFHFTPMPGIRTGQHYRVKAVAHYVVPGVDTPMRSSPAHVERLSYGVSSAAHPCYNCDTSISGAPPVVVSMAALDEIAENRGATRIKVWLNRRLTGDEEVNVPLIISGALEGTDFDLTRSANENHSGIQLVTMARRPVVKFTSGARVARLTLRALPKSDTADRSVQISLGNVTAGSLTNSVNAAANSASIAIKDEDAIRTLVTVAQTGEVEEGKRILFYFEADPAPASDLPVRFSITSGADYGVAKAEENIVIPAEGNANFWLQTAGNSTVDTDPTVTVEVLPSDGYVTNAASTATAVMVDDDVVYEVSIAGGAGGADVTEGDPVEYTLTVDPAPRRDFPIDLQVTVDGDYGVAAQNITSSVDSSGSKTFTLATMDDSADEADGSVTVSIQSSSEYELGTPSSTTINVLDDDLPPPVMTIASVYGLSTVTEGWSVPFTISGAPVQKTDYDIKVSIVQTGDFGVAEATERIITMPAFGTYTLNLATVDDSADEADGSVTVTILAGPRYELGSSTSATVNILDDDLPLPVMSLDADALVTEGASAEFTITGTPAQKADYDIKVSIAQTGDFGVTEASEKTVTVPAAGSQTLSVATAGDATAESNGSVTVTILPGSRYELGSDSAATTLIMDDDRPTVSIVNTSGTVTEGTDPQLPVILVRSDPVGEALPVTIKLQGGRHYGIRDGERTVTIPANTRLHTLRFPVEDDDYGDRDATLTITIEPRAGYNTLAMMNSGSYRLLNDDPDLSVRLSWGHPTIGEAHPGGAALRLDLNRTLRYGEVLNVPITATGGTTGVHYYLRTNESLGCTRTAYGNQSALKFTQYTKACLLILEPINGSITEDLPVTISFGTGDRAPSATGTPEGLVILGGPATVTIVNVD